MPYMKTLNSMFIIEMTKLACSIVWQLNPEVSMFVIGLNVRLTNVHGARAVNDIMSVSTLVLILALRVRVGMTLPTTVNMLATASRAASSRF